MRPPAIHGHCNLEGLELGAEPRHRGADVAGDGDGGNAENFRYFFGIHSNKESEFEDAGFAFVELFEPGEGFVDIDNIDGVFANAGDGNGFEGDGGGSTAALLAAEFADVIDQDLTHDSGGNIEELGAMTEIGLVLAGQAEEGLVDEFGGAEDFLRVAAASEVASSEAAQFGIDNGD